jgi:hypothetical protein
MPAAGRGLTSVLTASIVASMLAVVAAVALLFVSCGQGPAASSVATPAARSATPLPVISLSPSPGTPSPGPTESGTPFPSVSLIPAPVDADTTAIVLIDAWYRADRPRALEVATPEAVDALFALPRPSAPLTLDECYTVGTDQWGCQFPVEGGLIFVRVLKTGATYEVESAGFLAG